MSDENTHNQRLKQLRQLMKKQGIAALLVPRTDAFQGEYVAAHAERLAWLTGFTGSFGLAVIGHRHATLMVDGRYTVQAPRETAGTGIEIANYSPDVLEKTIKALAHKGGVLGFDPWLTTANESKKLQQIAKQAGITLRATDANLIDQLWADQPAPPANPIVHHPERYTGATTVEKIAAIRQTLAAKAVGAVVLSDPMSVAWLLNIRGADVPYTPVALVRAILPRKGPALLFADSTQLDAKTKNALGKNVALHHPTSLSQMLREVARKHKLVQVDPQICPAAIVQALQKAGAEIVEATDPVVFPRALKNTTEIKGARLAHQWDGTAMCNFLAWMAKTAGHEKLNEKQAEIKLEQFRRKSKRLVDLSFGAISATGPNAAQPHYHVTGNAGRSINNNQIYLIDSGGQYREGTTDITRTIIVGKPTPLMRRNFTLVLQGMIAVSEAVFPVGTTGIQIDAYARAALWKQGLDFDHGTGHGVGSFLSVHEGPARISKASQVPLQQGMILSNEPGYYKPGQYGIRIENLLVVQGPEKIKGGERPMLRFETLSFVPIDRNLIDAALLSAADKKWLNAYHAEVLKRHLPHVETENKTWLQNACAPLT